MNKSKAAQILKVLGKHVLIYLLTCLLVTNLVNISTAVITKTGTKELLILHPIVMFWAFVAVICVNLVQYLVGILLIKKVFKTNSLLAYAILGIISPLIFVWVVLGFKLVIEKSLSLLVVFIVVGALAGLFYGYMERRLFRKGNE